jgi:hypothetical protein
MVEGGQELSTNGTNAWDINQYLVTMIGKNSKTFYFTKRYHVSHGSKQHI